MSALLPSQVLDKAADLIEPEGKWGQRQYYDVSAGCRCIVGALSWVLDGGRSSAEYEVEGLRALQWVGKAVRLKMPPSDPASRIIEWNDRKTRKQSEVVSALRKAAELARSEGQ
jgi:hypothetical protein